jgi:hypothetical protein
MLNDRPDPAQQTVARNTRPLLKGMGLAASVIVPILVVTASTGSDPTSAGERAGELSVAPLLGGLAVGVWAKLAKRRWLWPDYGLRFALCTMAAFGLNAVGRTMITATAPRAPSAPVVPLTESEKQGLHLSYGWVRHSAFDFVLPVGPQFAPAPEIQSQINEKFAAMRGTFVWVLQAQDPDRLVLIFLARGMGNDEVAFRAMARGISRSAGTQATQVVEDELEWNRRTREFRYGARLPDGRYARTRCLPSSQARQPPYVVCVQTLGPDLNGLDPVRNQLVVR